MSAGLKCIRPTGRNVQLARALFEFTNFILLKTGGNNLLHRTVSIPNARYRDTSKMEAEMSDRTTCSSEEKALQIALPLAGPLLAFLIMIGICKCLALGLGGSHFKERSPLLIIVGLLFAFTLSASVYAGKEQRLCIDRPSFEPGRSPSSADATKGQPSNAGIAGVDQS